MITKGIRGAITVEENSTEAIGSAVIKLLTEMINRNKIETNLNVPNSLKMCLRVLIVVNCSETFEPEFVYLEGAEVLRK